MSGGEIVGILALSGMATGIFGATVLEKVNGMVYDYMVSEPVDGSDPMNGTKQSLDLLREAKAAIQLQIPGEYRGEEMSDSDWKQVPHMYAIAEYARARPGILSYYWTRRPILLHTLYLKWLRSVPADSPIHEQGKTVKVFVELHLKYFQNGLYGRLRDRLAL